MTQHIKTLISSVLLLAASYAFSAEPAAEASGPQRYSFPIPVRIDSQDSLSKTANLTLPALHLTKEAAKADPLTALAMETVEAVKAGPKDPKFEACLTAPAQKRRAAAFFRRMGKTGQLKAAYAVFVSPESAVVFFDAPGCTFKPDMRFLWLDLVKDGGKERFAWNPVARKTPLTSLIGESVAMADPTRPILPYAGESKAVDNIAYIDLTGDQNADNPALKFYKEAQSKFHALDLTAYGDAMTEKGREKFAAQYLGMSPEDQKKALSDYLTYDKSFKKMADLGELKVILFTRVRDNMVNSYDAAFIVQDGESFKIANFGQDQGPLAEYLIEQIK